MSIKKKFIHSVFYMALAKYSNVIIQLVITGILARILTPDDFGAVAISTIFITFFQLISDVGFSPAIIQSNNLAKRDLNGIFSTCFYIGITIAIFIYLISSCIADFYKIDVLKWLLRLLCLHSLFTCLNIVPEALLKKNKRFRFISVRTMLVNLICGCVAVCAAYYGVGVYSLLITPISSSIIVFIINYQQSPLKILHPRYCREGVSKVFNYSLYQFLYNFIYYISRNLDKLVVGKIMGSTPLGYYEKSYHLMLTPVSNLSSVVIPTIQPFFAEKQDDTQWMFKGCCKILHFLALLSFPISAFCFFSAREIILIVFGNQWEMAVLPFKILSLSIGFQVVYSPQGAFYQATNSTKRLFTSNVVVAALNILAIIVGTIIFHSINMLCLCIVICFVLSFFYVYYILVEKLYNQTFRSFLKIFTRPIAIALIMSIMLYLASSLFQENILISFTAKAIVAIVTFVPLLYFSGEYKYLNLRK